MDQAQVAAVEPVRVLRPGLAAQRRDGARGACGVFVVNAPRVGFELLPPIRLRWHRGRCVSSVFEMSMALDRLRGVSAWWAQQMRTRLRVAIGTRGGSL
jgi:hypothetical protein